MAKELEGIEMEVFADSWHYKRHSKVIDIYRHTLIKELEIVFEKEEPDVIRCGELKYLPTGMLERVMIEYGLGHKIESRYITYNKEENNTV